MTRPSEQQAFDPFATFVQLREGGGATALTWTPDFWRRLETRDGDRVVGTKRALEPADFHVDESEMHPEGDELLYLLTGEVDVLLEETDGERMIRLRGGQGCIVPRGVVAPAGAAPAGRPAVRQATSRNAAAPRREGRTRVEPALSGRGTAPCS